MIIIKSPAQIEKMRAAGHLLHEIMQKLKEVIRPGETTAAIDAYAEELIRRAGAEPSFLNYKGYPASICASVDDQVVHGIPSDDQVLQEGSILSIDCGLVLDGWQSDSAFTAGVGQISPQMEMLIKVCEQSFFEGVRQAIAGNRVGDIGHAVQSFAESHGYGVIRDLTGHGIGRSMHEDPNVPNFGDPGQGARLKAGMTLAVEPMLSMGGYQVFTDQDEWTVKTLDGSPCAHYEHTILIREDGPPELLTLPGFIWQ